MPILVKDNIGTADKMQTTGAYRPCFILVVLFSVVTFG